MKSWWLVLCIVLAAVLTGMALWFFYERDRKIYKALEVQIQAMRESGLFQDGRFD